MLLSNDRFEQEHVDQRRLPVGAEVVPGKGVHFRVWAPRRSQVAVVLDTEAASPAPAETALGAEGDGYFSGYVAHAAPGALYRFRVDGAERYPDPASRFQPEGPHG